MNDPILSFLGLVRKSGNIVFGMDAVKEQCLKGSAKLVLTTSDISENSLEKISLFLKQKPEIAFERLDCFKNDVEYVVGKFSAVMAILNENMARKTVTLINENKLKSSSDINTKNFERNVAYNDKI